MKSHEAYRIVGTPRFGGILVISDHASNRVPADIDLGLAHRELLDQHIAVDIGVAGVGRIMAQSAGIAAFQGGVSRLVSVDLGGAETLLAAAE